LIHWFLALQPSEPASGSDRTNAQHLISRKITNRRGSAGLKKVRATGNKTRVRVSTFERRNFRTHVTHCDCFTFASKGMDHVNFGFAA
jgi:hypothetical protein